MNEEQSKRVLPPRFALAVVVGGVVGLGILRGPGEIAAALPEPSLYLGLWLLGGLFVLLSTAVSAELLAMTPRSGGTYTLIRRAYGPYPGFLIGWLDWLSFAVDLAIKSVVVLEFIGLIFPETAPWRTLLAILVTTLFAAIQLRGVSTGALIQECATALIGLIIIGLSVVLLFVDSPVSDAATSLPATSGFNEWSLVIAAIVFAYDGWLYASYFSGEIKGGGGTTARSCIKGMAIVIALYMVLNIALVKSVGLSAIAGSEFALARALELAVSPEAAVVVVVAAILILLSHQNLEYMSGPRVLQALAVDGLATPRAKKIGSGGNPVFAIVVTWVVTVGLIIIGEFKFLLLLSVFLFVPLYLAVIVGVIILRKREPDYERPYKAWGHPYSTIFCLIGWTIITAYQVYAERETALYAVAMIAVSWPVYLYLTRTSSAESDTPA